MSRTTSPSPLEIRPRGSSRSLLLAALLTVLACACAASTCGYCSGEDDCGDACRDACESTGRPCACEGG